MQKILSITKSPICFFFFDQLLNCVWFLQPHELQYIKLPVLHYLPEFPQTHVHWVGVAIQPSHPLSSPSPPVFSLSQHQGLFQGVSCSHQVAKYWSFGFSISSSNEYSELISFRIDWFDLFAVQGTLRSLLQHHSSKASILWCSAFFASNSHIHTWPLEKPKPWLDGLCWQSNISAFEYTT